MTKEKIRKKLEKIRSDMAALQKEEKLLLQEEKAMEDAEKMKIIQWIGKSGNKRYANMSAEQLMFLKGLKEDEIEMIMKKRKEADEIAKADAEKKKAADNTVG